MRAAAVLVAAALAACAPVVDAPAERQRAADTADAAALARQLRVLPGVVHAEVVLHRPAADPLTTAPPAAPALSLVLVVDDRADQPRLAAAATALARTVAPAVTPTLVVEVGAVRPTLARVGPFTVEAGSKSPLKAALAIACAAIAALAGWIALRYRRGSSAQ